MPYVDDESAMTTISDGTAGNRSITA